MTPYGYRKKRHRIKTRRLIYAALFVVFLGTGTVAAVNIIIGQVAYMRARREYELLRQYAPAAAPSVTPAPVSPSPGPSPVGLSLPERPAEPAAEPEAAGEKAAELTPQSRQLLGINPDYIGWISIEGTNIDYPMVQGRDNGRYLTTGFTGEPSVSGAVFMDSGCVDRFEAPLAVLHGHNMKDGSMFSGLNRYLDFGYLAEHPEIAVVTPYGDTLTYRIVEVRSTDIHDAAYEMIYEDPESMRAYAASLSEAEEGRILVLSTCTNSGYNDERLLVFAAAE